MLDKLVHEPPIVTGYSLIDQQHIPIRRVAFIGLLSVPVWTVIFVATVRAFGGTLSIAPHVTVLGVLIAVVEFDVYHASRARGRARNRGSSLWRATQIRSGRRVCLHHVSRAGPSSTVPGNRTGAIAGDFNRRSGDSPHVAVRTRTDDDLSCWKWGRCFRRSVGSDEGLAVATRMPDLRPG